MSRQLLSQYQARLERLVQYGGSRNETSVRAAFQELLDRYAAARNLALVNELDYKTNLGTTVRPDGTLKNAVRQDVGYWESKDERDDLDAEIALKLGKGYLDANILFDDTRQVVLIQNGLEMGSYLRNDRSAVREDLDYVFSLFPRLSERLSQMGGTMSGGEQQMLAMGRALMSRPKLILMDEPSMGLAPLFVEKIFEIIKQVNEEGISVFVVEQNANVALSVADRGYVRVADG